MEIAAFVIGCVAFVLSGVSFGWQVYTWRQGRRFDVRAEIESQYVVVASGEYEIEVVVTNHGETVEAVHEIWLLYSEHTESGEVDAMLGPPSLWDRDLPERELAPRRHIRRTYDLLATRFGPFPSEVTAVVILQSGTRVTSAPHRTEARSRAVAEGYDPGSPSESPLRPARTRKPENPAMCRASISTATGIRSRLGTRAQSSS